jgi:hypothetical protein
MRRFFAVDGDVDLGALLLVQLQDFFFDDIAG